MEVLSFFLGGDNGLDGLGGPGVQLGSPDKKKRKANTQVNGHFLRNNWASKGNLNLVVGFVSCPN